MSLLLSRGLGESYLRGFAGPQVSLGSKVHGWRLARAEAMLAQKDSHHTAGVLFATDGTQQTTLAVLDNGPCRGRSVCLVPASL